MPRSAKPPRLYLRERFGREAAYVILDRGREIGTGFGPGSEPDAEAAFARYLAEKHRPAWRDRDPAHVALADVLTLYAQEVAAKLAHPELVGYHIPPLLDHFGDGSCWDVTEGTCRSYEGARIDGLSGRRPVVTGTARRELETLGAALNYAYRTRRITKPVIVWLPKKSQPRDRWLSRAEAAWLIAAALGFRAVAFNAQGKPVRWRRECEPQYHVARFILIALYTGTRHEAILRLRWGVNSEGGWFDLPNGVLYRRGEGEQETNKRRTPAPIIDRLRPHLKRWRSLTTVGPCEYRGELILRQKRGFERAREYAGLSDDVVPHVLKHTCCTWLLQSGVSTWDVAGYLGTSEAIIRRVYGHHSPDQLSAVRGAFHGRNLGSSRKLG